MKHVRLGMLGLVLTLMLPASVSAHVTLVPKEAVIGYSTLTVSVPTEKDISTVEVRLIVPDGVNVHGVLPVAGWTHRETRAMVDTMEGKMEESDGGHHDEGRVTEIVWSGGQIKKGEFMHFPVSVQYGGEPTTLSWKAYQTYADGTIVPWDGSNEKNPAPKVEMVQQSKLDSVTAAVDEMKKSGSDKSQMLSLLALGLSVVAIVMSRKGK